MFAASNSLEALNHLVTFLRIIGLCPYILDKSSGQLVVHKNICLVRTVRIFLILATATAGSQDGLYRTYETALELGLDYGINYGNLTFIFLTYFLMNKDFKDIVSALNQAMVIDSELDQLSPLKIDHKASKTSSVFYIVASITIITIFSSCQYILVISGLSYTSTLRNLSYLIGVIVSASLECLLFTMLRELRRRYTNINGILVFIQKENLDVTDAFERLKRIKRIYEQLGNLRILVGTFSFQILIKYYMSYTSFLASLFFILSGREENWMAYASLVVWSAMSMMELIGFTYYYDKALQETKKSAIYYENTVQIYDAHYTKRGFFYSQTKFERNMFSVCGLFVINWNFLLVMCGSILSNLAVLLQFNRIAERNK